MSDKLETALLARWWWNADSPAAPKLEPRKIRGKVQKSSWPTGWSEELEPAAFTYELLARVSWHYALAVTLMPYASSELYPLGNSFMGLVPSERCEVQDRMEHAGCILSPKYPVTFPVTNSELQEEPPLGFMRITVEFDPLHIAPGDVAKQVEERIKREAKNHGVPLLKGSEGRRNAPWAWETLELLDRMLAGERLETYDRQKAHALLTRHLHLWPQWYLSSNDPKVWNRPDARGFLQANRRDKQ